ncbi:MAG: energy transducer TonB [Sphingomonadales bacterium]|nr:MAG: energy transducer TonB [Sphingomonadales bacterium]
MGRYEPELLDDLAASDGIRIERDDTLVASLKLTGTAKAIPVLQACAHRVAKANPIDPFDDGSDAPNTGGLAKPVSARGSAGAWVTDDDYPAAALRAEQEGTVGFKLDVDAAGAVLNCAITTSSGSALLDVTACSLIKRRARFNPAQNAAGVKIAGTFESRFTWRIPR